ncbi:MAG: ABC transporter permease [Phycisphaerales bacterium]
MIAFILRRLLYMIPVLLGVLAITFALFFVVADDPVLQFAGQNPSEATLRALRRQYELDVPALPSPGWLRGEDLIESTRRERFEVAIAEARALPDLSAEQLDDIEALVSAWRDRDLAGQQQTLNAELRKIVGASSPVLDFSDIALDESQERDVAKRSIWDAQFFRVMRFDFADSMVHEQSIWQLIRTKAPRSLAVTIPIFFIGLAIELVFSLIAASRRGKPTDTIITILAVLAMSIPFLTYVIFGQWIAAETRILPVSGWQPGFEGVRYLVFPVIIGVIAGLGSAVRFYRAVLLEEMDRDYVRTARAKGVKQADVLFIHVLRNAGIPIVTRLSVIIPFLITGSLLIETTFEIPGLGDLMLSSIQTRDFWVVMPLTYLIAIVYSIAVLLTDVAYALIDPRVRVSG